MNNHSDQNTIETTINLNGEWQFRSAEDTTWLPATVPGTNFTDLLANDKISDPFYRDNEDKLQWIENLDWHYRKTFTIDASWLEKQAVYLQLDGLDTIAHVTLNGKVVAETCNMFIGKNVNVKDALITGENTLEIVFKSPIEEYKHKPEELGVIYPAENDKTDLKLSVFCRKAPYHFGWDWGPKFVTSGIWKDISLVAVDYARIGDINIEQRHFNDDLVQLNIHAELNVEQACKGQLKITCKQLPNFSQSVTFDAVKGVHELSTDIDINDPQLWWPNGLGDAFLYDFDFSLIVIDTEVDHKPIAVGLRTIEVINEPDEHGESFYVKINGNPLFMKGANYIPSDSFLPEVSADKYKKIFTDATEANMNMLRVWGGGIYENDEFYDLADQHGILIWQDFMFACTLYPGDAEFLENVEEEAIHQVKRLRNHPSIALWCGNNEVSMGIDKWEWAEKFGYSEQQYAELIGDYQHLFSEILPKIVEALDDKFYFASSPIGFWENPEDDGKGDNHYWGVWHGEEPFTEFKRRVPRFMSEFGFQSFPLLDSMKKYSVEEDRDLASRVMRVHQKHPRGNQLIKTYMEGEYHEAKDFESFLYLSQIQQAMGMKAGFEAHRIGMPFCMGTLYWQLNDCWPVASWSGIDYYGKWKALHYQVKRSFEHVGLFVESDDDNENTINIFAVSDKLETKQFTYKASLIDFNGQVVWETSRETEVEGSKSQVIDSLCVNSLVKYLNKASLSKEQVVLKVSLQDLNNPLADELIEHHYFAPTKDLALSKPNLSISTDISGDTLDVTVTTNTLTKSLYLGIEGDTGNFSDNFFDLIPGVKKVISLVWTNETDEEKQQKAASITTMSIIDTFE